MDITKIRAQLRDVQRRIDDAQANAGCWDDRYYSSLLKEQEELLKKQGQVEFLQKAAADLGVEIDFDKPIEVIPPLGVDEPPEPEPETELQRLQRSRDSAARFYGAHDPMTCFLDRCIDEIR